MSRYLLPDMHLSAFSYTILCDPLEIIVVTL